MSNEKKQKFVGFKPAFSSDVIVYVNLDMVECIKQAEDADTKERYTQIWSKGYCYVTTAVPVEKVIRMLTTEADVAV